MARLFGDSYDIYSNTYDLALRYASATGYALLPAGSTAFGAGQGMSCASNTYLQASWETGTNETTIYISIRTKFAAGSGNGSQYLTITFRDGSNNQMCVVWSNNGSISILSGGLGGIPLGGSPYASMFVLNTWNSWQVKCVINNTTGSVEVRKDGSGVPAFVLINANTRVGSTNNTVNNFIITSNDSNWLIDDLWFNSDNGTAPTGWPGDVRFKQMVVSSQSQTQFIPSPSLFTFGETTTTNLQTQAQDVITTTKAFTSNASGALTQIILQMSVGYSGNAIMGLYDNTGTAGAPGVLIATSNVVTNPVTGTNTFTFASRPIVTSGFVYFMALLSNTGCTTKAGASTTGYTQARNYGSGFPNPAAATPGTVNDIAAVATIVPFNWFLVSDVTEDRDTTNVHSSNVGVQDIYGFTAGGLGVTPAAILGTNLFVVWKKSDAGSRTATIGIDANGSGDVAQLSNANPSSSYTYAQKWLPTDPTGAAWTVTTLEGSKPSIIITA